jgi:hypothetical protein
MTPRVWRALPVEVEMPQTAAQDSVLRLALGMFVADRRAPLTSKQRKRVVARLQNAELHDQPFTAEEKARLKKPLLDYIKEYHDRIYDIVSAQFHLEESPRG